MTHLKTAKTSFQLKVDVPAKAMLFGEYGVLRGGKAVALTFGNYHFTLKLSLTPCEDDREFGDVIVKSDFFSAGQIIFSQGQLKNFPKSLPQTESFFFEALLQPWQNFLQGYSLVCEIEKSFSPDLGFGSSSALIAGISWCLEKFLQHQGIMFTREDFWRYIRLSLSNIQGQGSGYDVGVQLAALEHDTQNLRFWIYQNNPWLPCPDIEPWFPDVQQVSGYGCFVSTGVYANTRQALKRFSDLPEDEQDFFATAQKSLAEKFLQDPSCAHLANLMREAQRLEQSQGLVVHHQPLLQHWPWKTMGAGLGDCLWVLATKEEISSCLGSSFDSIVFDFRAISRPQPEELL